MGACRDNYLAAVDSGVPLPVMTGLEPAGGSSSGGSGASPWCLPSDVFVALFVFVLLIACHDSCKSWLGALRSREPYPRACSLGADRITGALGGLPTAVQVPPAAGRGQGQTAPAASVKAGQGQAPAAQQPAPAARQALAPTPGQSSSPLPHPCSG